MMLSLNLSPDCPGLCALNNTIPTLRAITQLPYQFCASRA